LSSQSARILVSAQRKPKAKKFLSAIDHLTQFSCVSSRLLGSRRVKEGKFYGQAAAMERKNLFHAQFLLALLLIFPQNAQFFN